MAKKKKGKDQSQGNGSPGLDHQSNGNAAGRLRLDLQTAELELLLKVCQKYRSTLPGHLLSSKDQLALADELLEKLRSLQPQE